MAKFSRKLLCYLVILLSLTPGTVSAGESKQLALTFDDGPSVHTEKLLDYMRDKGIHATFFLVANRIPNYPQTVCRQADEGHELGYHSYAHKDQTKLTTERIFKEYQRASRELFELTGKDYTLWRSPGGTFDRRVLEAIPLPHVYWSVDTRDWESKNREAVRKAILSSAQDGAIILLHDLYASSVDGAIAAMAACHYLD